jgi:hypothetical protein
MEAAKPSDLTPFEQALVRALVSAIIAEIRDTQRKPEYERKHSALHL